MNSGLDGADIARPAQGFDQDLREPHPTSHAQHWKLIDRHLCRGSAIFPADNRSKETRRLRVTGDGVP